jgi:toxin HigB-1
MITPMRTAEDYREGLGDRRKCPVDHLWATDLGNAVSAQVMIDNHHAARYYAAMIVSFKDADTAALAQGKRVRRFVNIEAVARRKLRQLQIAGRLDDLRVPPGNRLEVLTGDRQGQYSIRVNDQFRVCFRWSSAGAEDVEIVDYHR